MELLAIPSTAAGADGPRAATAEAEIGAAGLAPRARGSRASVAPRSRARPGTSLGHDVLLALLMALAMAATVFLYR